MIDNNHELTIGELDAVNGGFLREIVAKIVDFAAEACKSSDGPTSSGGQNDPAQQFQQILQQLTQ